MNSSSSDRRAECINHQVFPCQCTNTQVGVPTTPNTQVGVPHQQCAIQVFHLLPHKLVYHSCDHISVLQKCSIQVGFNTVEHLCTQHTIKCSTYSHHFLNGSSITYPRHPLSQPWQSNNFSQRAKTQEAQITFFCDIYTSVCQILYT